MKIVIPFKARNPKSRLSNLLNEEERVNFAKSMLLDVIDAMPDMEILIVTPESIDIDFDKVTAKNLRVLIDERSLDDAVNSLIDEEKEIAIIMSDLPLLNREVVDRFFNEEADVVVAPGRKGGTNMLLVRNSKFRVSYHYGSFFKHVKMAKELGLSCKIFDSFYSSIDVDEESDLLELLLHGEGKKSWKFLIDRGFRVEFKKDPVFYKE
ncbi:2-phospho-L-lactate guanylyltransferase [Archaeoglobales archaeon]|nr:MAG: 2-phospho-L-lactate guanylyltransferase [Archaeoglobales archaeon]